MMPLMKIKNKKSIKISQQEEQKQQNKIEGLKRDVVIWQQIYNKYSIIGKIIANIILFFIKNIIKVVPLIILLSPNTFEDSIIYELIGVISNQVDWKCITPLCICVCFIFWCSKYFQTKPQNQIDKQKIN